MKTTTILAYRLKADLLSIIFVYPLTLIGNKRYKLNKIPQFFGEGGIFSMAIANLISRIEQSRETQNDIDSIYDQLCTVILDEMNSKIPCFDSSKKTRKRFKHTKPYWSEELSLLWQSLRRKEHGFVKCKGNRSVWSGLRRDYLNARQHFDRKLRQTERAYRTALAYDIENLSSTTKMSSDARFRL